jgi:hypothetical protein
MVSAESLPSASFYDFIPEKQLIVRGSRGLQVLWLFSLLGLRRKRQKYITNHDLTELTHHLFNFSSNTMFLAAASLKSWGTG